MSFLGSNLCAMNNFRQIYKLKMEKLCISLIKIIPLFDTKMYCKLSLSVLYWKKNMEDFLFFYIIQLLVYIYFTD